MQMTKESLASRLKVTPAEIDLLESKHFVRANQNGLYDQFDYDRVVRNNTALLLIKRNRQQQEQQQDQAKQVAHRQSFRDLPGRRDAERAEQRRLDEQTRIGELSEQRAKERKQENTASEIAAMRQELTSLRNELRDALQPINDQTDEA